MFNSKLCIMRPNITVETSPAPFMMLPHQKSNANKKRFSMLRSALVHQFDDGLSNIEYLTKIFSVKYFKSFTHLAVNVSRV